MTNAKSICLMFLLAVFLVDHAQNIYLIEVVRSNCLHFIMSIIFFFLKISKDGGVLKYIFYVQAQ
jgi:hypothetical protein